jgi:hypothetical protein
VRKVIVEIVLEIVVRSSVIESLGKEMKIDLKRPQFLTHFLTFPIGRHGEGLKLSSIYS